MVRIPSVWWQRFKIVQCVTSPDMEKLEKKKQSGCLLWMEKKIKKERLQLMLALRFSQFCSQINKWKRSPQMYGRLVLLVSHFMASGVEARKSARFAHGAWWVAESELNPGILLPHPAAVHPPPLPNSPPVLGVPARGLRRTESLQDSSISHYQLPLASGE